MRDQYDLLWQAHTKAPHICYPWQLGKGYERYRANDDGEPAQIAGMPIYNQIQHFELTQVLVTVVRYNGGANLGVGGLYKLIKPPHGNVWEEGASRFAQHKTDHSFTLYLWVDGAGHAHHRRGKPKHCSTKDAPELPDRPEHQCP